MSRTFFRKFLPAVPRAAGRPAFRASALRGGEFGIIRAPGAARARKPARTQDADNSSAAERRGSQAGGRHRLAPCLAPHEGPTRIVSVRVHRRNRPGGPALARLGPPGRSIRPRTFNHLYIGRKDRATPSGQESFRAVIAQAALPSVAGFPLFASAKLLAEGDSLPKEERPPPGPPAFRAGNPLGDRPWSIPSIYL